MTVKEIADQADMIVAGYAYKIKKGYIEVIDLSDIKRVATIQNNIIAESLMSDEEDSIILDYYMRNKDLLEESVYA